MKSLFTPAKTNYSFLYFCTINDLEKNSRELATFVSSLVDLENCLVGFDRLLWSSLSSGQMPSQLYSFNFYGSKNGCEVSEGVLVILSEEEISDFPAFLEISIKTLDKQSFNEGEVADSYEEDDEFENCYYASLLNWAVFAGVVEEVKGVKNIWFDESVQLLIGKSIYVQDDWVESYFNSQSFNDKSSLKSAVHLLLPCSEKIKSLVEAVQDKERIHLDPEIKGIYC